MRLFQRPLFAGLTIFALAGVFALPLAAQPRHAHPHKLKMAVTIDDLPAHGDLPPGLTPLDVALTMIAHLKQENLPPTYGFINADKIALDPIGPQVLQAWRDAGQPLGNHTWSHASLDETTAEAFENQILQNEPTLAHFMPHEDWHWFRYPYLDEGDTLAKRRAVRAFLFAHHYRIAEVSMDFEDYLWNDPYARCMARHDDVAIERLHDTYLSTAASYIKVFRTLSHLTYGRDVPYVLLLHIGAFDARMLPELLAMYRKHGFTFVSLPEATQDRAFARDPDVGVKGGGTLQEMWMTKRKLDFPTNTKPYKELEAICQ
jgi:peptidoglycan/xylan/chitin deacetylase (PgdA/CDA1 family)